jgi:hypothetical protein
LNWLDLLRLQGIECFVFCISKYCHVKVGVPFFGKWMCITRNKALNRRDLY